MLTLASLFDGIGGFPLCAVRNGVTPVWASEIEPFPIMVTRKRFPQMQHYGDVSKICGADVPPVDIITFGSPCQDLSVAGKQAGIHDGARSSLFFEAVRIIKEMRASAKADTGADEPVRPRWAVWENVPGAYSSHGGRDFQAVLQSFVGVKDPAADVPMPEKGKWQNAGCIVGDGYSIAWRTYDAQYWPGTPQRRKRIYLVADFDGERAGEILFEREGRAGHSEPREAAREGTAGDAAAGAGRDCVAFHVQQDPIYGEIAPCIGGQSQATVGVFMGGQGEKARGIGWSETITPTLKSAASGTNTVPDVVYQNTGIGWWSESRIAETLRTPCGGDATKANIVCCVYPQITDALCANSHPGSYTGQDTYNDMLPVIETNQPPRRYIVRRLTPLECCRLQGYPDGWTEGMSIMEPSEEEISFWTAVWRDWAEINGKKPKSRSGVIKWLQNAGSDSAEYKAYGNSLAIPCANDVIRRIAEFARRE